MNLNLKNSRKRKGETKMIDRNELRNRLDGIAFMTLTPFDEQGNILYDAYRKNVRFLVNKIKELKCEKCTITPCGSNGEFVHLTEEEQKEIIRICVEEVNGVVPVIAGTGRASTKQTIAVSKYAQEVGADGVQVILPYYFVPTEEGMYRHYEELAKAIDIGIVIYNNPAFSGSWIKPALMKKMLAGYGDHIVAIKENTPHLMLFNGMAKALKGTGVKLLSGFGEQWFAYQFPWGADGFATPFGNFFPEYPIKFQEAAKNYDFDEMRRLLAMMDPYYAFVGRCSAKRPDTGMMVKPGGSIYGEGNVRFGVLKEAMNLMGLDGGHMRLPLTGLNDDERAELKGILTDLGLIK